MIALSKEDLNPEIQIKLSNEMTKLLIQIKNFLYQVLIIMELKDLTSYLFEKCEIEDDQ